MAPGFAVLLESQLLNATDKDFHGHRWDKKIITLALHLWAKLVFDAVMNFYKINFSVHKFISID